MRIPRLGGRKIRRAENMVAINEIACTASSWIATRIICFVNNNRTDYNNHFLPCHATDRYIVYEGRKVGNFKRELPGNGKVDDSEDLLQSRGKVSLTEKYISRV